MSDLEKQRIVELATRYLEPHQPAAYRLNVLKDRVRQSGEWIYVPVEATDSDAPSYDYYGRLAEAEIALEDAEEANLLFIPVRSN